MSHSQYPKKNFQGLQKSHGSIDQDTEAKYKEINT